jgi:hypothetical protein
MCRVGFHPRFTEQLGNHLQLIRHGCAKESQQIECGGFGALLPLFADSGSWLNRLSVTGLDES